MNKKGFTLIEIIICISLITIIGTASFFGIKLVSKNITINKLEQIKDKILTATEVYIETNKETYNKLYNEKNGVMIPLNVLVNEGFLDTTGTKLDDKELENNYVISMLSGDPSGECVDIKTITSWNETSNEPLYICVDSSGNSNLAIIDPKDTSNINKASKEYFYYYGANPANYIKYNNKVFRILVINPDDSLVLYNASSFSGVFNNSDILPVDILDSSTTQSISITGHSHSSNFIQELSSGGGYSYNDNLNGAPITRSDFMMASIISSSKTSSCNGVGACTYKITIQSIITNNFNSTTDCFGCTSVSGTISGYKIRLKPCMKITSGIGTISTPYILENKC